MALKNKKWYSNLDDFIFSDVAKDKNKENEKLKEIEYLCLEGGGGKGNVYVGALLVLDDLKITPIKEINGTKYSNIKGISGASSGAITCLLLSIGCSAKDIIEVTTKPDKNNKNSGESKSLFYDFNQFFEFPLAGIYKGVKFNSNKNVNESIYFTHRAKKIDPLFNFKKKDVENEVKEQIKSKAEKVKYGEFTWEQIIGDDNSSHDNLRKAFKKSKTKRLLFRLGIMLFVASNLDILIGIIKKVKPNLGKIFTISFYTGFLPLLSGILSNNFKRRQGEKFLDYGARLIRDLLEVVSYIGFLFYWGKKGIKKIIELTGGSDKDELESIDVFKEDATSHIVNTGMSVLLDRGILTGVNVRRFMVKQMAHFLPLNFPNSSFSSDCNLYCQINGIDQLIEQEKLEQVELNSYDVTNQNTNETTHYNGSELNRDIENFLFDNLTREEHFAKSITFKQLYKYTDVDLKVISVNSITGEPKVFSKNETPDMLVADAICMSMSIPFAFKPTCFTGVVDTSLDFKDPYNESYRGLYVDGGTLNNLPLHLFDNYIGGVDFSEFFTDKDYLPYNPKVLGLRLSDNEPDDKYKSHKDHSDKHYKYDHYFNKYWEKSKRKLTKKERKKQIVKKYRFPSNTDKKMVRITDNPFVTLPDHLGDMFSTLMYGAEEGQFNNNPVRKQFIELFCYDIDIFCFNPEVNLKIFAQIRAVVKTARWLGYSKEKLEKLIRESFPEEFNKDEPFIFKNVFENPANVIHLANYINMAYGNETQIKYDVKETLNI